MVWRDGPCSTYQVRKSFLESPTPTWSGSAGAIYPAVRRLERAGLLRSRKADRDGRGTRLYRITTAGRRALEAWLTPPLPDDAVGISSDPVRTRVLFLEVLPPARRRKFLDGVERQLDEHLAELREARRAVLASGEPSLALAARGALLVARARRRWLREVRESL